MENYGKIHKKIVTAIEIMKTKILPILILFLFIYFGAAVPNTSAQIIYKIPDGVMPMDWKDFKGMLMLGGKQPWGIFVAYPNDGESLDELKTRAGKTIAKMFVHDEAKVDKVEWKTITVAANKGDASDTALQKLYESDTETLQLTFFERQGAGPKLLYGYFARKSKTSKDKDDSADFLGEKGKGNKSFTAFWKSFSGK